MLSTTNANNLIAWLSNNLLTAFDLDGGQVRLSFLQYFGNDSYVNTDFNGYSNACNVLTNSFVDGSIPAQKASPYSILRNYLLNQKFYGRPGYPQVLVLFTAINDDTLLNAWGIAKEVRDSGTILAVVGLNQNKTAPYLYYLSDQFISYPDFFPAPSSSDPIHYGLAQWISTQACAHKAVSVPTSSNEPQTADQSLTNAIGTPCSTDITHAYLDVQFYFDVNIDDNALNDLGYQLAQTLAGLTLSNKLPRASCFSLTAVSSNKLNTVNSLKSCVDYGTLYSTLFTLGDTYSKSANTFYLNPVLDAAQTAFASRPYNRAQLLIIASKKLSASINNATKDKAKALRDQGIYIVTVDYGGNDLQGIATPGQSYKNTESNLDDSLTNIFGYANCVCPNGLSQLVVVDPKTSHSVPYADCLEVNRDSSPWLFAESKCENNGGTLVSLSSVEKFNYVQDLVKAQDGAVGPEYIVGLHQLRNGTTAWHYYENHLLALGKYPRGFDASGYCGYVRQQSKGNTPFQLGACNKKAPYVCQYRACDSSRFCEL